jgi:hypothetical protein
VSGAGEIRIEVLVRCVLWFVFLSLFAALPIPSYAQAPLCSTPNTPDCTHGLPTYQYELLLGEMLARPAPDVRPLQVDTVTLNEYVHYRVQEGGSTLYDAPDGSPVGTVNGRVIYQAFRQRQGDWVQTPDGYWLPASAVAVGRASSFSGVFIDEPLPYPLAWIVWTIQPSAYPGYAPDAGTETLERFTRVYIYASVEREGRLWHLVAPGAWVAEENIAWLMPARRPDGVKGRWFAVDLAQQILTAYEEDRLVFATLVSTGRPGAATNEGVFTIGERARRKPMNGVLDTPGYYYVEGVPYVMYFDGTIALHGTYWHHSFGFRTSSGCVNLSVADGQWAYTWTDNFYANTVVKVWRSSGI